MIKGKDMSPMEIFGKELINQAMECNGHKEILDRVIMPNMAEINRRTGQENDPRFMAYAMEFTLNEIKRLKLDIKH